ncbi:hypothetical protein ES319_D06G086700v1 [Gossypium barbadense]|uniref:Uncharacterized protein n=1 Tax=Gossypium barbadense TaxID=3634 RepID=A0A5J5R6J6_GOSBA|nr:hypothetical protein ES319_D06G086700v1 [Gossypium barbadense]
MSTEKLRRAALPPVQERNRRKPEELNAGKQVNSRKEKYEKAIAALTEMEKRAVMAESMEEATLHYHSGNNKAKPSLSPRCVVDFPLSNILCLGEKHFIMDDKTKPDQLVQLVLQRTW